MAQVTVTNGVVTAMALESTAAGFVEYQFNPNTSNYAEEVTVDLTTGSTYYAQTVTLSLNRREAAKRQSLLLIALGQPGLTIIVKDSNGLFWVFGLNDDKMFLTGNTGGSGTAKADHNGYVLTFTGEDVAPAFEVENQQVVDSVLTASPVSPTSP